MLFAHTLNLGYGLLASVLSVSVFFLLGQVIVPRRWDQTFGRGESAGVLGAALYATSCWFGIAAGVPLPRIALWFALITGALVLLRLRWLWSALRARGFFTGETLGWLLGFSLLYAIGYLFTLPPVTSSELPMAWTGNVDLLTYTRYTNYLEHLRPLTGLGASHLDRIYLQTPAVFYFLGWLAQWFHQDPLAATMPAQFAYSALIGTFTARMSHAVFGLSKTAAFGIACILVCGPFFRYVSGAFYLSTLTAMPVVLYLLWTTVSCRPARLLDLGVAIRYLSAFALLLLTYSTLFYSAIVFQIGALGLVWIADAQSGGLRLAAWRTSARASVRALLTMIVPLALIAGVFYERILWTLDEMRNLSVKGTAGWPLDMISPLAVLGAPLVRIDGYQCADCWGVAIQHPAYRPLVTGIYCGVALLMAFLYFWRFRRQTSSAQRALVGLSGAAFVLYCVYFNLIGSSYQQWKFASYFALPLSFVVFAGGYQLLRLSSGWSRRTLAAAGAAVVIVCAGGNAVVHAMKDPPLMTFPGTFRNIATLDEMRSFREITVQMVETFGDYGTYLAMHYLPTKLVHAVSKIIEPMESLSWDKVSNARPLLIQNYGCEGVGHTETMTVEGVGCLLSAPPSVTIGTAYPFARSFLFVDFTGLGDRGPDGRANKRASVGLTIMADTQRAPVRQDAFLNLQLAPAGVSAPNGTPIVATWGAGRQAATSIAAPGWISLPIRGDDWKGERILTLAITIDFPGAVDQSPRVLFESLSVSLLPTGRRVAPSDKRD